MLHGGQHRRRRRTTGRIAPLVLLVLIVLVLGIVAGLLIAKVKLGDSSGPTPETADTAETSSASSREEVEVPVPPADTGGDVPAVFWHTILPTLPFAIAGIVVIAVVLFVMHHLDRRSMMSRLPHRPHRTEGSGAAADAHHPGATVSGNERQMGVRDLMSEPPSKGRSAVSGISGDTLARLSRDITEAVIRDVRLHFTQSEQKLDHSIGTLRTAIAEGLRGTVRDLKLETLTEERDAAKEEASVTKTELRQLREELGSRLQDLSRQASQGLSSAELTALVGSSPEDLEAMEAALKERARAGRDLDELLEGAKQAGDKQEFLARRLAVLTDRVYSPSAFAVRLESSNLPEVLRKIVAFCDAEIQLKRLSLIESLKSYGLVPLSILPKVTKFTEKQHHCVGRRQTRDPALAERVHSCEKVGFMLGATLVRPAEVIVYEYSPSAPADSADSGTGVRPASREKTRAFHSYHRRSGGS